MMSGDVLLVRRCSTAALDATALSGAVRFHPLCSNTPASRRAMTDSCQPRVGQAATHTDCASAGRVMGKAGQAGWNGITVAGWWNAGDQVTVVIGRLVKYISQPSRRVGSAPQ